MSARGKALFYYEPGVALPPGAVFTRATTATFIDQNGILQTAPAGVMRDGHYRNGARRYLNEPAATNLALQSEDWSSATYTKSNVSASPNVATSPAGTLTADLLSRLDVISNAQVTQPLTLVSGTSYTFSVFAKANTLGNQLGLRHQSPYPTRAEAVFDLAAGTIKGTNTSGYTNVSAAMQYIGFGWWRCSLSFTAPNSNAGFLLMAPTDASRSVGSFEGNTATLADILVWGLQAEVGPMTSYIATTTIAVTRNADLLSIPIVLTDLLPEEMTMYTRFTQHGVGAANPRVFQIGANTPNNANTVSFLINFSGTTGAIQSAMKDGAGVFNTAPTSANTSIGDLLEMRALFETAIPATRYGLTVNKGRETVSAYGATAQAFAAFNAAFIYIGNVVGATVGNIEIEKIVVLAGLHSLEEVRGAGISGIGGSGFTGGWYLAENGQYVQLPREPKPIKPDKPKLTEAQRRALEAKRRNEEITRSFRERQEELRLASARAISNAQALWGDAEPEGNKQFLRLPKSERRQTGPRSLSLPQSAPRSKQPRTLSLPKSGEHVRKTKTVRFPWRRS